MISACALTGVGIYLEKTPNGLILSKLAPKGERKIVQHRNHSQWDRFELPLWQFLLARPANVKGRLSNRFCCSKRNAQGARLSPKD
jgi:hypothetical protein